MFTMVYLIFPVSSFDGAATHKSNRKWCSKGLLWRSQRALRFHSRPSGWEILSWWPRGRLGSLRRGCWRGQVSIWNDSCKVCLIMAILIWNYSRNINIPWHDQGMGDGDYMFAFQQVVMPIAQEFDPDLVISMALPSSDFLYMCWPRLSLGWIWCCCRWCAGWLLRLPCLLWPDDPHVDESGQRKIGCMSRGKFSPLISETKKKKRKKRVWLTADQGGYNFRSISKSALAVTRVLMGEPPDRLTGVQPSESAIRTVRQVMSIQASYWRCMFPKPTKHSAWGERLHGMCITICHECTNFV